MLFRKKHHPSCQYAMTGSFSTLFQLLKGEINANNLISSISSSHSLRVYHSYVWIKKEKLDDVKQLLQHVFLREEVTFYSKLTCHSSFFENENKVEMERTLKSNMNYTDIIIVEFVVVEASYVEFDVAF